jgi:hypothetical protein
MTIDKKQRVTLFLDPSLLKQAKMQALIEDKSLSALIERALTKYLPKETIIILIILWALGLLTSITLGGLIHALLVIALILIVVRLLQGRSVV